MVNIEDIVVLDNNGLKRYQKEILGIAKDLVQLCEDNDIKYSLSGGSVLGAVRHKGLIPWDDDIDINIPRKSYNKLLELFDEKLGHKYYLQTPKNSPQLGIMVTQMREKNTIARRKYDWNIKKCGISIDIYIVDNIFENRLLRFMQQSVSTLISFIVSSIRTLNNKEIPKEISEIESKPVKMKVLKSITGKVFGVVPLKRWILLLDKINGMCNDENSTFVTIPTGRRHFRGEIQKRKDILLYKRVQFEDTEFNIPKNYDVYLKSLYGNDYMVIPSKDKRESHVFLELKYND